MDVVAHRAGNTPDSARAAARSADMIELDVHVLRARVELRHAKVLHPTRRLWERWFMLPAGTRGVPIAEVLDAVPDGTPLMIDVKAFTRRSAELIRRALPEASRIVVSTRSWWTLGVFESRPETTLLRSCGSAWQLWWVLRVTRFGPGRGVCVHESRLSTTVVRALQRRTPILYTWGVNTAARSAELEQLGVTGVIVDDRDLLRNSQK